jgi:hypothetical protein
VVQPLAARLRAGGIADIDQGPFAAEEILADGLSRGADQTGRQVERPRRLYQGALVGGAARPPAVFGAKLHHPRHEHRHKKQQTQQHQRLPGVDETPLSPRRRPRGCMAVALYLFHKRSFSKNFVR